MRDFIIGRVGGVPTFHGAFNRHDPPPLSLSLSPAYRQPSFSTSVESLRAESPPASRESARPWSKLYEKMPGLAEHVIGLLGKESKGK